MQHTAQILEDGDAQVIVLPESCHVDVSEVWITVDEVTGVITLNPKLSDTNEVSESQRQRDIQIMTAVIAAKAKEDLNHSKGSAT